MGGHECAVEEILGTLQTGATLSKTDMKMVLFGAGIKLLCTQQGIKIKQAKMYAMYASCTVVLNLHLQR